MDPNALRLAWRDRSLEYFFARPLCCVVHLAVIACWVAFTLVNNQTATVNCLGVVIAMAIEYTRRWYCPRWRILVPLLWTAPCLWFPGWVPPLVLAFLFCELTVQIAVDFADWCVLRGEPGGVPLG